MTDDNREFPPHVVLTVALKSAGADLIETSGAIAEAYLHEKFRAVDTLVTNAGGLITEAQRAVASYVAQATGPADRCVPRPPADEPVPPAPAAYTPDPLEWTRVTTMSGSNHFFIAADGRNIAELWSFSDAESVGNARLCQSDGSRPMSDGEIRAFCARLAILRWGLDYGALVKAGVLAPSDLVAVYRYFRDPADFLLSADLATARRVWTLIEAQIEDRHVTWFFEGLAPSSADVDGGAR